MMQLPSDLHAPTTATVGWCHASADDVAALATGFTGDWQITKVRADHWVDLVRMLKVGSVPRSRKLVLSVGSWSAVQTDGVFGTDPSGLPMLVARDLGQVALMASHSSSTTDRLGGTRFELHDPRAIGSPSLVRRHLYCCDQGNGRWEFSQEGDPLGGENPDRYKARRVRDRFTIDALEQLLRHVGVPVDVEPSHEALLVAPK